MFTSNELWRIKAAAAHVAYPTPKRRKTIARTSRHSRLILSPPAVATCLCTEKALGEPKSARTGQHQFDAGITCHRLLTDQSERGSPRAPPHGCEDGRTARRWCLQNSRVDKPLRAAPWMILRRTARFVHPASCPSGNPPCRRDWTYVRLLWPTSPSMGYGRGEVKRGSPDGYTDQYSLFAE